MGNLAELARHPYDGENLSMWLLGVENNLMTHNQLPSTMLLQFN